jgi:phosphatidylinositol 3-kinase
VDWTNSQEAKQATELINQWEPVESNHVDVHEHSLTLNFEVTDALELLSKSFTSPTVRDYAVSRLEQASNQVCQVFLFGIRLDWVLSSFIT